MLRHASHHEPFYIPFNVGAETKKHIALIEKTNVKSSVQLMLTDEKSPWGADICIDVLGNVPGAKMTTISGTFLTKVFEGPYSSAGKWAEEMKTYVAAKGKEMKKLYFSYTTCPKCAKAYGKNYVVLFAQVAWLPRNPAIPIILRPPRRIIHY